MDDIHINITKNTRVESIKKRLRVERHEEFSKILARISSKLGIEAKILYNQEGVVIEETEDIKGGDTLYVSQGEQFWPRNKLSSSISSKPENKIRTIKLGVIGPQAVGKSALTVRYVRKVFIDEYLPSIEDLYKRNISIDGQQVEINILDSSGLDEYVVMRRNWYCEREAFLMVYAINNRGSFEAMKMFNEQLSSYRAGKAAPITLVGNKSDIEDRKVTKEEGMQLAKQFGANFVETSAKKDSYVKEAFEDTAKKAYELKYKSQKSGEAEEKKCCKLL